MEIFIKNKPISVDTYNEILDYANQDKVEIKVHDLIFAFDGVVPHRKSDKKSDPRYLDGRKDLPYVTRIRKHLKVKGYNLRAISNRQYYSIRRI